MNNKKHGYTLAEIMVVLLVLTIIFAAFAPIFTKRRLATTGSKYNVWEYFDKVTYDAFYNPGKHDVAGEAFIGVTPEGKPAISTTFLPLSKLVIRSSKSVTSEASLQRQIQFRYGRTNSSSDKGVFAGTWFMDGKNALMGGTYHRIDSLSNTSPARNNTAIGYDSLSSIIYAQNNTAIGYKALNKVSGSSAVGNTAIGYQAGMKNSSVGNTFIGYQAGKETTGRENTAIGYNSMQGNGSNNTYLGAFSGPTSGSANQNTAIGYQALNNLTNGSRNIAIGNGALKNLQSGDNNTAIGYQACSALVKSSNKTCIGANSGPTSSGMAQKNSYIMSLDGGDTEKRTYIGSKPKGYSGDAVIEIHNISKPVNNTQFGNSGGTGMYYLPNPVKDNSTTIINGNLIVRGRPYFTVANKLHHFHDLNYMESGSDATRAYGYGQNNSYYAQCASNNSTYSFSGSCVNLYPTKMSDRRLKDIGSKNTAGIAELRKLKIYNYTFKNDANKTPQVGVIAQELMKVFPNSVVEGEDGYLRIRWDEMFYAAINAVKELDRRIVALVKRTTDVETQITKLEQENTSLKTQVAALTTRVNKLKNQ